MKTKFDLEIEKFKDNFSKFKDKNIILYGTGRMTMTLLNANLDFSFVGLCDRDIKQIGKIILGVKVLSRSEAEKMGDILVINTSETYWNTIYQRIQNWSIPIYFLNGELAKIKKSCVCSDLDYWQSSMHELEQMCQKHDIISFDVFDTLVMRKVLYPVDVFRILNQSNKYNIDFLSIRKQASSKYEYANIHQIYDEIARLLNNNQIAQHLKQLELNLEQSLTIARKDMADLCIKLMKNKQVYFISDMYFPKDIICKLLNNAGICAKENQILVSCDFLKSKEKGDLWQYYKTEIIKDKSALHIGDNLVSDVQNPKKYHIHTYRVLSAVEMLQYSSINGILSNIESLYSSIATGLICAELFNSPFSLCETKGQVKLNDNIQAGYCLIAPIMDTFCRWLFCKAKEDNINSYLFFAREGYLLLPLFKHLKILYGQDSITDDFYLEISRRAIWTVSVSNENDIYDIAKFPYQGLLSQFLCERLGVKISIEQDVEMSDLQNDNDKLKQYLKPYMSDILERCKWERKNYTKYLKSLNICGKFAVIDSQFHGTTQYYFSKYVNKKIDGYYFCACTDTSNSYFQNNMYGCFQGDNPEKTNIHKQAQFLESYFTSPNGMLEYINNELKPIYTHKMSNQKYFYIREQMQIGVKKFISDIFNIYEQCNNIAGDWVWSDYMFGIAMNNGYDVTEDMKKGFYFDNKALNNREMLIWGG